MHKLCDSEMLVDCGDGLRFCLADGREAFVIRYAGQVRAFVNQCRHQPTELDWNLGQFFDADKEYLICASHGALYSPETGLCVAGPCRGKALEAVSIIEENGSVYLS